MSSNDPIGQGTVLRVNGRTNRAWPVATAALLVVCVFVWLAFEIRAGLLINTDELLTAERSREMLLLGRSAVHFNFQPSFVKPPLQYWLTTLTLPHIDNREFAVRIWPLIYGTLAAIALGWLAFLVDRDRRWLIALSVALLVSCPLFLTETSRALLDAGLMFFVTLVVVFAQLARKQPAWWLAVAAVCSLGTLQKMPLGFLIWFIILIVRLTSANERRALRSPWLVAGIFLAAGSLLVWWLVQSWKFHAPVSEIFRLGEAVVLTGPSRLGVRPYLEIPFHLSRIWLCGAFALLTPVALLFFKKARAHAGVMEMSILCVAVIVLAIVFNFRSVRYTLPIIPCLCLLLAIALLWLFENQRAIGATTLAIAAVFFVVGLVQGKLKIDNRRRDLSDQLPLAQEIGASQKPETQIVLIKHAGEELLLDSFYLFYGNLRFPVETFSTDRFPATLPRPAIGVCAERDFPFVRENYPGAMIQLRRGDFVFWRADGG